MNRAIGVKKEERVLKEHGSEETCLRQKKKLTAIPCATFRHLRGGPVDSQGWTLLHEKEKRR